MLIPLPFTLQEDEFKEKHSEPKEGNVFEDRHEKDFNVSMALVSPSEGPEIQPVRVDLMIGHGN
jgi:hypothetical protein